MAAKSLPPGFRFHPTDEELVGYYLKRKVHAWKIELDIIPEVDLYKCEPWDLPDKSFLPGRDLEWYFFSLRDKKYPNGLRTNRATEAGYWKATGKDRKVISHMRLIGMKKTLVFHTGRAPHGSRTDWVMHEYRLEETECEASTSFQEGYALCRVFKKGGLGRRIGVQYSAIRDNDFSSGQSNTCNKSLLLSVQEQSEEKASLSSPVDEEDQTNSREASSEAINTMNVDDGVWKRWLQPVNDDTATCNFPRLNESISHPKVDHNETSGSPLKDGGFPHIKSCLSLSDSTTLSAYLLGEHVHPSVKEAVIIGQHHRYEQTSEQNTDIPKNEDYLQDDDFVPGWNIESDHKNSSNYNAQEETDLFLLSSFVSQNCNMESFYEQQEQLLFFNHFLRQNSNPENLAFMLT